MINQYLSDIQISYVETPRHWCPHSEKYTGADSLITALREGWSVNRIVSRQDVLYSGARHTSIYYFELQRDDRTVTMPIISTPFIVRFVASLQLRVIHTADSERADPRITAEEPALQELALA